MSPAVLPFFKEPSATRQSIFPIAWDTSVLAWRGGVARVGKITTTTGSELTLDGDLLAIMELLYREVTARRALDRTFDDMVKEIQHLIDQMSDEERRAYFAESLFLNTVRYENDRLEAYMKKLSRK